MIEEISIAAKITKEHLRRVERSQSFLYRGLIVSIITGIGIAYYYLNLSERGSGEPLILGAGFTLIIAFLYWFLQIRPIFVPTNSGELDLMRGEQQGSLSDIFEIEHAVSIYSSFNPSIESRAADTEDIVKYIRKRTMKFSGEDSIKNFDTVILVNETKRKLFELSLSTLRLKLEEAREKALESKKSVDDTVKVSRNDKPLKNVANQIDLVTIRLKTEVARLTVRSDMYIIVGSGITIIAGYYLYLIGDQMLGAFGESSIQSISDITLGDVAAILAKLSIVVFVEIFAFYYLRLYKILNEDMKFYQNEITNIEMKILALNSAENGGYEKTLDSVAVQLVMTERNFLIEENQSTVDLRRKELESDFLKSSTSELVKIVKAIK